MVVFTYIASTAAWASFSSAVFGTSALGTAVANAAIAIGQSVSWSLVAASLLAPKVPRQQVQATISQTDAPRIRAYGRNLMGGQRVFYEAQDGRLHQLIVMHHGEVDGLISFWWDGAPLEPESRIGLADGGARFSRYKAAYFRNGSGAGGDYNGVFDGDGLGNQDLHQAFPTLWTPQHRLDGQATFYALFGDPSDGDFPKEFPKGAYTTVQAEIRASRVRNMAGDLVYSENAGLVIRDLMTHPDGWNIPLVRLDTASWQGFVGLSAEPVPVLGGGTQPRYSICGFYTLDDALKDVTARFLAACDGQIYETADGKIGILGGQWSDPDVTITDADILSIQMTDGYDPFTDYNILKGAFVSPAHGYQPTEVAEIRDEAALATQEARYEQYDIDLCPSSSQMQRLLKIKLAKDRREYTGTIRTNLVGLKARFPKGDGIHTIRVVAPEFGLDGVFEVTSHIFSVPDGYCEIGIASIANPYGWTVDEEQPLPPGVEDLETPDNALPAFEGTTLAQELVQVTGGVQGVRMVVTVADPGRGDLALEAQVARGTYAATGPWTDPQPQWIDMAADEYRAETGVLDDGATYTVRIRWRRGGDWTLAGTQVVTANPVTPDPPTEFGAYAAGPSVYLDWINAPEEFFRTRIYRNTSGDFGTATLRATVAGSPGQPSAYVDELPIFPPSGTIYYWAVTVNASNVQSVPAGPEIITY